MNQNAIVVRENEAMRRHFGYFINVLLVPLIVLAAAGTVEAVSDSASDQLVVRPIPLETAKSFPEIPTGLVAGDLDEDGIADLIVSMASPTAGALAVMLGNPAAIYPYGVRARQQKAEGTFSTEPFHNLARLIPVPIVPELLATADLDNDGHVDVLLGRRGDQSLWLLSGDGHGGFRVPQQYALPGRIISLATGEVNEVDGLGDLVVAVRAADGDQLLLYADARGALLGVPESIALPVPVSSLAVGELTPGLGSVVLTAGHELLVVLGAGSLRDTESKPRVERLALPGKAAAAAVLRRIGYEQDIVVVLGDGRTYLVPHDDISGLISGAKLASQIAGEMVELGSVALDDSDTPQRIMTARLDGRPGDELVVFGQQGVMVASLYGEHHKRLRTGDLIDGISAPLAVLAMRLGPPAMDQLVVAQASGDQRLLTAARQAGPTFEVNSNNDGADSALDGVCETEPGNGICTLRAAIEEANNAVETPVTISFAGMNPSDTIIFPLSELPSVTNQVVIDGTTHPDGMVEINGAAAGYADGLTISADQSTFRGLAIHSFNDFLYPYHSGISVSGSANIIEGCNLGVDSEAATNLGNGKYGVAISGPENLVGGPAIEARCIISGNGEGGVAIGWGELASVQGCLIGTDGAGANAIPNGQGVVVSEGNLYGDSIIIGGTAAGEGNVISGNTDAGIHLSSNAANTKVWGNRIGTDITGTVALGNSVGIEVAGPLAVRIGGSAELAGNTISGNDNEGIFINKPGTPGCTIQGNRIGTDITGTLALGNQIGIKLDTDDPSDNVIGLSWGSSGNTISGNLSHGIVIKGPAGALIRGNRIGTGAGGVEIGNGGFGVLLEDASSTAVGGTGDFHYNQIAYNSFDGIAVIGGSLFNTFNRNLLYGNGGQAIDLNDDGVTANDAGDDDEGANRGMNYPEVVAADKLVDGRLRVTYTIDSDPANADYDIRVELFAAGEDGQGKTFLASDTWTTSDYVAGSRTVTLVNQAPTTTLDLIVATATDADGNTSEQSVPAPLTTLSTDIFTDGFESGDTTRWSASVS